MAIVSRDVSILILGLLYLKYELSYLPVVMETILFKPHEEQHNPIITEVMKRNSNLRERLNFFIIAIFFVAKLLKFNHTPYTQKCAIAVLRYICRQNCSRYLILEAPGIFNSCRELPSLHEKLICTLRFSFLIIAVNIVYLVSSERPGDSECNSM